MIHASHLFHHYSGRPVLRDVSFSVRPGELLAVMGPNGMGKSTLLSILAGTLSPLEGDVTIDGKVRRGSVDDEIALRKMCAYLPDHPWLPNNVSGRELLLATGRIWERPERQLIDNIDRVLRLFHLEDKADEPTAGYSNGQKKKIALAATLITDAKVLLLDEPFTGGLDPSGIRALKEVLAVLRRRDDVTVVMATQIASIAEAIADRILVMGEGEVITCGTLDELRSQAGKANDAPLDSVLEHFIDPGGDERLTDYLEVNHR